MFAATSGYRSDGDAGVMHVGARYYDPQVGRFITRDTGMRLTIAATIPERAGCR